MYSMKKLMKRIYFKSNSSSKGQSFVELSIVILLLMLLAGGIAEFGVLLNRYLNLLDGVREAARYSASYDPFAPCTGSSTPDSDGVCKLFWNNAEIQAVQVISPVELSRPRNDDIVLSFFTVDGDGATCVRHIVRYPTYEGENGYSWVKYGDGTTAGTGTANKTSQQSTAAVHAMMNDCAPPVSVMLVEIFYNYPQTLKAPFYEQAFPDPIPTYVFAVMPLKSVTIP
jgi:Flp pilus assembly protein TadG